MARDAFLLMSNLNHTVHPKETEVVHNKCIFCNETRFSTVPVFIVVHYAMYHGLLCSYLSLSYSIKLHIQSQ